MVRLAPADAERLAADLLARAGAPQDHANCVAHHLVEADQLGVASHGLSRLPQFLSECADSSRIAWRLSS